MFHGRVAVVSSVGCCRISICKSSCWRDRKRKKRGIVCVCGLMDRRRDTTESNEQAMRQAKKREQPKKKKAKNDAKDDASGTTEKRTKKQNTRVKKREDHK